jgi:hypothetical protein
MDTLRAVVIAELEKYAGKAYNGFSYLDSNSDQTHFVITSVAQIKDRRVVNTALIVQLVNDVVVIDRDNFDKSLVEALLQAGVPRSQIVLAYLGENVPESV